MSVNEWRSILVLPTTTLRDAIIALDQAGLRMALVVDADDRLLGTLTDGDVRRALLRAMPMTDAVSDAMNHTPTTASVDWARSKILGLMERLSLLHIPIVDERGRVVGMETLHHLLQKPRRDNPVFLMAGGFGTRLQPLTDHCPKPLLKVGDKPILELILENFVNAGFHRFYVSTHYKAEMVREQIGDGSRWGVDVQYVCEDAPLGTAGALGLLPRDQIDLPLFVMNGDLLTNIDVEQLLRFHEDSEGVATMCAREHTYRVPYGVLNIDGQQIVSMEEKPVHRCFVNAGIYVLDPAVAKSVAPGTRIDMPTLLEQQIANGDRVNVFPIREYWLDIGRMEDFQRAQTDVADLFVHA